MPKISKHAEESLKKPEFQKWLHELTTLGYSENIMLEAEHMEVIVLYYTEKKTTRQALDEYKKFLKRWNALNSK